MEVTKKEWHVRISATPQCNLRCIYCNPSGLKEDKKYIDQENIKLILRAFYEAGVKRVHWTGGEPSTIRLLELVKYATALGYYDQIITTNGVLLKNKVRPLVESGLRRFNISIDSLIHQNYKKITGTDALGDALQTLEQTVEYSNTITKINIVALKQNLTELHSFVEYAEGINSREEIPLVALKIIELCPNNPVFFDETNKVDLNEMHVSRDEILFELKKNYDLRSTQVEGDNPNCDYHFLGETNVPVGFVTMPSLGYPCGGQSNRKLRVNPFGVIGACLAKPAFNYSDYSFDELVSQIKRIKTERECETEENFADRKHFQGNFGMWRFGDCKK